MSGVTGSLDARFAAEMGRLLGPDFPPALGVAVSGGGDSMAMLALVHNWARVWGVPLHVVTVDHGLRAESADEAAMVARECALLGHPHDILTWERSGDPTGNLMDAARRARLGLIDGWRGAIDHVLMAHTQDDVAETFVMRLARGAGVDGLAAMAPLRRVEGARGPWHVVRPCLSMGREELRHYVRTLQVPWAEDPTNRDPAYERARIRAQSAALAAVGLDTAALAATATRLARSKEALSLRAAEAAARIVETEPRTGALRIGRDGFAALDRDTQLRLLGGALRWVGGAEYAPRSVPLEALADRLLAGGGGTLAGCDVTCGREVIHVFREYAAVADHVAAPGALWDGRWRLAGPDRAEVRALGQPGWEQALPWRDADTAPPHRRALGLPALWDGGTLLACPALAPGSAEGLSFHPPRGAMTLDAFLLSD